MKNRVVLCFLCMGTLASADTLALKNGSTINGRFVGGDNQTIRFSVGEQVNTYSLVDIDNLRFTSENSPASSASNSNGDSAPPPQSQATGAPSNSNAPYSAPPVSTASSANVSNVEVPSGTQVVVRLIDAADSKIDHLGQTYRASVETPVVINGQTVIPRGSDAVAVLNDQENSGKISGKTSVTIALRSVSVNGRTYDLATSTVNKTSGSRGVKSGERIGGGAAIGAIIGALAGGGRGAAIGAASGGALGAGVQVATSGERVKIPSETSLTFALTNPLYISSSSN